jgi:hypothetical protein
VAAQRGALCRGIAFGSLGGGSARRSRYCGDSRADYPYSTKDTVADAIRFLESAPGGIFEVTEMRVYHGTMLWQRMAKEDRLVGNPLRYVYTLPDPVAFNFAGIFMRLRAEAFWNHSIAYRTHDAFLAHALGHRLRPELVRRAVPVGMSALRDQVVKLYVDSYWKALALAEAGVGASDASLLVAETRNRSLQLQKRLDDLVQSLAHHLHTSPNVFSPSRAAAAGAIAFTFLGGSACSNAHPTMHDGAAAAAEEVHMQEVGPAQPEGRIADGSVVCTEALAAEQRERHEAAALQAAACFNGMISFDGGTVSASSVALPSAPNHQTSVCAGGGDAAQSFAAHEVEWSSAVEQAVRGLDHACLVAMSTPNTVSFQLPIYVTGGAADQTKTLWAALDKCHGTAGTSSAFSITIDQNGQVVGTTGLSSDVASCLMTALQGLVFPCLADAQICQEEAVLLE